MAQRMTMQIFSDYFGQQRCISYPELLFWLLNRGNSFFSESVYNGTSEVITALSQCSAVPVPPNCLKADMEFVYCAQKLVKTILQSCPIEKNLEELLSGFVNKDDSVNDEDFVQCVFRAFGVDPESGEEVVLKIDNFSELCLLLLHETEESVCLHDFVHCRIRWILTSASSPSSSPSPLLP